jgi:hypothetical protein
MKDFLQESGYKKDKKNYTPPILQLGEFNGVNWLAEILPEIIWIGLLQDKFGLGFGSKLALQISETTNKFHSLNGTKQWLAPLSCYSELTENEKAEIKKELTNLGHINNYEKAFGLITFLYPKFPLSFLIDDISDVKQDISVSEFKIFLSNLYDRTNFATTFMQATAVDMAFQSDLLCANIGTPLAQFDEISNFPNTEISKQVASSIRQTINLFFGNNNLFSSNGEWKKYFWNRGLELEKCY